jgi:hypothetical protein
LKKHLFIWVIFLYSAIQFAYSNNQIEISLLTCSSGSESFSSWGHSAIRIVDKENSIDVVYDFGLFDFDTPNFYLKFIKGNLKYKLGLHNSYRFIQSYISEDRQVIEQKLNLSEESEINIVSRLKYLHKPENRYYYYDFVKKNCTSELRDLIFNNVETDFQNKEIKKSSRSQINEYLNNKPWIKLGINLIFGTSVDKKLDKFGSMFLPDYLCWELNNVKVNGDKLVASEIRFNELKINKSSHPILLNPITVFSILLLFVLIFKSWKAQLPVLIIIGLVGILILTVWVLTEHEELKSNFNLLWCNPLYILSAFYLKKNKFKFYLSIILQLMLVGIVIVWISKIQSFEIAFGIIVLILSIYNIRAIKKSVEIDAPGYYKKRFFKLLK